MDEKLGEQDLFIYELSDRIEKSLESAKLPSTGHYLIHTV